MDLRYKREIFLQKPPVDNCFLYIIGNLTWFAAPTIACLWVTCARKFWAELCTNISLIKKPTITKKMYK